MIQLKYIKHEKYAYISQYYYISFHLYIYYNLGYTTNYDNNRAKAISTLADISQRQQKYYLKHRDFATKFMDLGLDNQDFDNCRYIFFMNNDVSFKKGPVTKYIDVPQYIKFNEDRIYAITCYKMEKPDCDILSADYYGNIDIIESINVWPLPEPKWHEWK